MKLRSTALGAALALVATAAAGGDGEKCTYSTQECLDYMASKMQNSGWVGVELDNAADNVGMKVTKVVTESPAEAAGIQTGDVLLAINGIELSDANQEKLQEAKASLKPGSAVKWTMRRGDSERELNLTLAPMPADVLARWVGSHMLEHAEVTVASNTPTN
ncbi:MAG: PDZ domain-containing protein [Candidatus Eiseniibacteriota bacterium]